MEKSEGKSWEISTSFTVPVDNPTVSLGIEDLKAYSPDLCYIQEGSLGKSQVWVGNWASINILEYPSLKRRSLIVPSNLIRENVVMMGNGRKLGCSNNDEDGPYQVVLVLDSCESLESLKEVSLKEVSLSARSLKEASPSDQSLEILSRKPLKIDYQGETVVKMLEKEVKRDNLREIHSILETLPLLGFINKKDPGYKKIIKRLSRDIYIHCKYPQTNIAYYPVGYYHLLQRSIVDYRKGSMLEQEILSKEDIDYVENVVISATRKANKEASLRSLEILPCCNAGYRMYIEIPTILAATSDMSKYDFSTLDNFFQLAKMLKVKDLFEDVLLSEGGWRLFHIPGAEEIKCLPLIDNRLFHRALVNASEQEVADVVVTHLKSIPSDKTFNPSPLDLRVSWFFCLKNIMDIWLKTEEYHGDDPIIKHAKCLSNLSLKFSHDDESFIENLSKYVKLSAIDWSNTYISGKIIYDLCEYGSSKPRFYYLIPEVNVGDDYDNSHGKAAIKDMKVKKNGRLTVRWAPSSTYVFSGVTGFYFPDQKFKVVKNNIIDIVIVTDDPEKFQAQTLTYYNSLLGIYPSLKFNPGESVKKKIYFHNPASKKEDINQPDFLVSMGDWADVLVNDNPQRRCGYGKFEDDMASPHIFGTASFMASLLNWMTSSSSEMRGQYYLNPEILDVKTEMRGTYINLDPKSTYRVEAIYDHIG